MKTMTQTGKKYDIKFKKKKEKNIINDYFIIIF